MEIMEKLVDIILYLIPAAGVVAAVYVILKQYFENQQKSNESEWKEKRTKAYFPMQVQAYERLILFLERMHPERIVFRLNKPGMSARQLQNEIFKTIRDEFDHNLTQQLYMSVKAWELVKSAKADTLEIVKVAAEQVDKNADSFAFSAAILETVSKLKRAPSDIAVDYLKAEFRKKME